MNVRDPGFVLGDCAGTVEFPEGNLWAWVSCYSSKPKNGRHDTYLLQGGKVFAVVGRIRVDNTVGEVHS